MSDMPRGRNRKVTDEELIKAARKVAGPSFTAGELAEIVGVHRETARAHLNNLVTSDVLEKKQPGADTIYWFATAR